MPRPHPASVHQAPERSPPTVTPTARAPADGDDRDPWELTRGRLQVPARLRPAGVGPLPWCARRQGLPLVGRGGRAGVGAGVGRQRMRLARWDAGGMLLPSRADRHLEAEPLHALRKAQEIQRAQGLDAAPLLQIVELEGCADLGGAHGVRQVLQGKEMSFLNRANP